SLLLSALLLVGGSLGDRYGRRHVFVIGVIIFGAASAWCGLAPGIRSLIMARAVQGFGAALLVPGSLALIRRSFREEDRGIALGLGALVWGLIESTRLGFAHPAIVAALVAGLVLIVTFVFLERQSRHPMVPLALFRSRTFAGANLLTLLLYGALGGTLFFVPLNLIQVQRYSPTAAGAGLLPFILIMFLLPRWAGGLGPKYAS